MTENNIKIDIPDCISKPIEEGLTPVTKSLGASIANTISVAWELVFGGIDTKLEKVKYKRQKELESFKQELDSKISKIPAENVVEAKMNIVGPTLDAAKYYFEEERLRNMFSSLIASSIDKDTTTLVHPSFTEIIKQLSVVDAKMLLFLSENESIYQNVFPISNYTLTNLSSEGQYTYLKNIFLSDTSIDNLTIDLIKSNCSSLVNLERLGLITITYDKCISEYDYSIFINTPAYHQLSLSIKNSSWDSIEIEKGILNLTQFGLNFISTCLKK